MSDILKNCKDDNVKFTKAERKILEALCRDPKQALILSSLDFGKELGVSDATVLRFSKKLGFDKYSDFKKYLAEEMDRQKSISARIFEHMEKGRYSRADNLAILLSEEVDNLLTFQEQVSFEAIRDLAGTMLSSRTIYTVGTGSSRSMSNLLSWHCNVLGLNSRSIEESGYGLFEKLAHIGKEDVVILFCVPTFLKDEIKLLEYLDRKKVPTAVVTNNRWSKITKYGDFVFQLNMENSSFFHSYLLTVEFINLLLMAIFERDKEKYYRILRENEEEQAFLYDADF